MYDHGRGMAIASRRRIKVVDSLTQRKGSMAMEGVRGNTSWSGQDSAVLEAVHGRGSWSSKGVVEGVCSKRRDSRRGLMIKVYHGRAPWSWQGSMIMRALHGSRKRLRERG